jgi:hypothetical protein
MNAVPPVGLAFFTTLYFALVKIPIDDSQYGPCKQTGTRE